MGPVQNGQQYVHKVSKQLCEKQSKQMQKKLNSIHSVSFANFSQSWKAKTKTSILFIFFFFFHHHAKKDVEYSPDEKWMKHGSRIVLLEYGGPFL